MGFPREREGAQIIHAELVGVGGIEIGEQAFRFRDGVFRDWGKDDRDIQSLFLRARKKLGEQRPVREQARAAGVSDAYAPGGAGEGGQVQRGFALERVERQGEEAPVRREAVRRQRERPVSGQRKRDRAAQPRRFLPGEAARGRVHVGAAGERVGEVLVVAQRLQAKILRIQLQRPPRLLREGGTRHVHHAQHAQPGALLMGNPPPIDRTSHIRRAVIGQKAHSQRRKRLRAMRAKPHLPVG